MEEAENFDLLDYAYVVWRRKWVFLFVLTVVLAAALLLIWKQPVVYRSTGTILVERQAIPEQWVNSTITTYADERIQAIGQRVLTTENLVRIIDKFDLFPDLREKRTLNQLTTLARRNFSVDNVVRSGPRPREAGTAAFMVSYEDSSPEKALNVTNELVNLYLDENKKARTQAATDTRLFLEAEADRIERQLTDIEEKVSKFKKENVGVLPEHQDINIQAYERVEQEMDTIDTRLASLEERKIVLEASIASARRVLSASRASAIADGVAIDPSRQRLDELRAEYTSLQTRYSESHPDLKRLRREIGILESEIGSGSGGVQLSGNTAAALSIQDDAAIIQLNSDLKTAINEQSALRARKIELGKKLDDLEERINKTPGVELEYSALIRDYENTQNKYNEIRAKQNTARVAQSLEEEQKGERFTLIDPPQLATRPYSPDFMKLYVMAFGLAFISAFGSVFGMEYLDGTVRNVKSVEAVTGVPVLATVGYIQNSSERQRQLISRVIMIGSLILLGLGALYVLMLYKSEGDTSQIDTLLEIIKSWVPDLKLPG